MSEMPGAEEIVYPLTELGGDNVRVGNFIRPANFRIPDLCVGCPLAESLKSPQISRVRGLYPVSTDGVRHIGTFRDYVSDVLVLSDDSGAEFEPVYLGDLPIVSPFSVEHERPDSRVLGEAHDAVDRCESPGSKKKLFRGNEAVCLSGLAKIKDYHLSGWRLAVDLESLLDKNNTVVGEGTPAEMQQMLQKARARRDAGIALREPYDGSKESSERSRAMLDLILSALEG